MQPSWADLIQDWARERFPLLVVDASARGGLKPVKLYCQSGIGRGVDHLVWVVSILHTGCAEPFQARSGEIQVWNSSGNANYLIKLNSADPNLFNQIEIFVKKTYQGLINNGTVIDTGALSHSQL